MSPSTDPARSGGTGPRAKRAGTGGEYFVLLPAVFLAGDVLGSIVRAIRHRELDVTLDFTDDAAANALTEDTAVPLRGMAELSIPFSDLAGVTIGMLIAAKIILVLGLIACSWWAGRVLNRVAEGRAFADQPIIDLGRIFWAGGATLVFYGALLILGSNLVTGDLGLAEHVNNSVSTLDIFTALAILGAVEVVRRAFVSGKKAHDELEGVI